MKHHEFSSVWLKRLTQTGVSIYTDTIETVTQKNGQVEAILLSHGQVVLTEVLFNQQGAVPNTQVAETLGVRLNDKHYIQVDSEQRTNRPFIYAAGDVTSLHSHQLITAAHEGSMAAQAANYDLYEEFQRLS